MKRRPFATAMHVARLAAAALFLIAPAAAMGQSITITTIDQLQLIGSDPGYPLDGDYVLGGDIDAAATDAWNGGEGFAPIGTRAAPFSGSFDGRGYAVENLHISRPGTDDVGLFASVSGSGAPAIIRNLTLASADIEGDSYVGALAGYKSNCLVYNCTASGTVRAQGDYAGGLVGWSQAGTPITNCASACAVTGQLGIGGLVGYNSACLIKNCYATGAVNATDYAGGLAGWSQGGAQVNTCYSTAAVTGQNGIGGLVGYNDSSTVTICYSAGAVSVPAGQAGSLIGGLVGWSTTATATDCFWDTEASGQATSSGGTGKTTAEMQTRSTFEGAGWDFTTVWSQCDGRNYPFFRSTGGGEPPQAQPDAYSAFTNAAFTKEAPGVLENDSDADCDSLTARLVTGPANGTLTLNGDGSFTYTPASDFSGTDTFTYRVIAGGDNSTDATVTLTVGNAAPTAADDAYTTDQITPLYARIPGVLANDTDRNDDELTAELVDGPAHGTLNLNAAGWFIYTPDKEFTGTDTFTYTASDGELSSDPATVTIEVEALCPIAGLFGEGSPEVAALRSYRDEVLAQSAPGRAAIRLYYRAAPLVEGVLAGSPRLQRLAKSMVTGVLLPALRER